MDIVGRMLEAMVVTLREGVEAALVVGVLLAYLRKTDRGALARYVLWGLGAAILASLLGAALFQRYGVDPENETLEGALMFLAAGLVGSLALWMWRTGRSLRGRLEQRLDAVVGSVGGATAGRRAALGVFAVSFLLVLREGVETVLFLAALTGTIGANPLYNALGGSLGLLLATLFGYLLVQGSVRVNLQRFFGLTGIVLAVLVAKLVAGGLHEFFEVGLLPSSPVWLAVVGLFTRETTSLLILILLIALPALYVAAEGWRLAAPPPAPRAQVAERRKALAAFQRSRRWMLTTGAGGLLLSLLLGVILVRRAAARGYDPAPVPVAPVDGLVRVPVPEDRKLHKHVVDVDRIPVRFFLLRREDGSLASAFDVCYICPPRGYVQDGDQLICKNCDAPINEATVGLTGGCNPVPLPATVDAGQVTVAMAELAKGRARFVKA
jgi:high-affinity iron transporter